MKEQETETAMEKPEFRVDPMLAPIIDSLRERGTQEAHALAVVLETQSVTRQEVSWQTPRILAQGGIIERIEAQTTKTNGRVTRLEQFVLGGRVVLWTVIVVIVLVGTFFPNELSPFAKRFLELFK